MGLQGTERERVGEKLRQGMINVEDLLDIAADDVVARLTGRKEDFEECKEVEDGPLDDRTSLRVGWLCGELWWASVLLAAQRLPRLIIIHA